MAEFSSPSVPQFPQFARQPIARAHSISVREKSWEWLKDAFLLVAGTLLAATLVYVIPTASGQNSYGSFDAFGYAILLYVDKIYAVEFQPFLILYPQGINPTYTPLYAALIHGIFLLPSLFSIYKLETRNYFSSILLALSIPESTIFLGAVSKEGLAICAVVANVAAYSFYFRQRWLLWTVFLLFSVAIAEISRPGFAVPFLGAILISYYPTFSHRWKYGFIFAGIGCALVVIALLFGPFYDQFSSAYASAREFLFWFEREMGSESPLKSSVRYFFTIVFGSDYPGLQFVITGIAFSLAKSIIYLLAIPLISLPEQISMPYFTWAFAWQIAVTISSCLTVYEMLLYTRTRMAVSNQKKCVIWFGFALLFIVALSTAIFHVRYRAPAMIAIIAGFWLARSPKRLISVAASAMTFGCALYAIKIMA